MSVFTLKRYTSAKLLILFVSCFYGYSYGGEETLPFGEIVITGEAVQSASVVEISGEDIEIRGARTVDEALDFIQGVRVSAGRKNEPEILLRGFEQDKILVLVDGVPVSSPYYGYLDLSHISVADIEKIKVVKGAASALYGANAMGGVVNIITKKAGKAPVYRVSGRFADYGTTLGSIKYSSTFGKFNLSLSGTKDLSGGFKLSGGYLPQDNEDGSKRANSDYDKLNGSVKLGFRPNDNHDMAFSVLYVDSSKGIPHHDSASKADFRRFSEWKKTMIAFNDVSKVNDKLTVRARAYYDLYSNVLDEYEDINYSVIDDSSSHGSYAVGTQVYADYRESDTHSFRASFNARGDFHRDYDSDSLTWERYHENTYSFGAEDEVVYLDRFLFKMGASLDMYRDEKAVSPVFNVIYNHDRETTFNLDMSMKTRFPTLRQLYGSKGSLELNSQKNTNLEVGVKRTMGYFTGRLSVFTNNVVDLIDRVEGGDKYENLFEVFYNGIEAGITGKPVEGLSCGVNYTFMVAKDRNPWLVGRAENELPYVPGSKWDFRILYKPDSETRISLLGLLNGRMYAYNRDEEQETIPAYSLWNVKVSRRFFDRADVSVAINNVLDANYIEETGYPQPGRILVISMNVGI